MELVASCSPAKIHRDISNDLGVMYDSVILLHVHTHMLDRSNYCDFIEVLKLRK